MAKKYLYIIGVNYESLTGVVGIVAGSSTEAYEMVEKLYGSGSGHCVVLKSINIDTDENGEIFKLYGKFWR